MLYLLKYLQIKLVLLNPQNDTYQIINLFYHIIILEFHLINKNKLYFQKIIHLPLNTYYFNPIQHDVDFSFLIQNKSQIKDLLY